MRTRVLGLALLSVVVGACGSVAPSPAAPAPTAAAPSPTPSTAPVASPSIAVASPSATTELVADVDIGGRTMHLVCVGPTDVDEPVILLEAGLGDNATAWGGIMRAMGTAHRLCAYDRAGVGQSEPAAERSRTTADHVTDLRALLDAADIDGPFVIGSHSYGAVVAILYTATHPDDVAGLVFVDPRSPRTSQLFRAALPDVTEDEPDGLVQVRYSLEEFETDPLLNRENLDLRRSYEAANAALDTPGPSFGDRPVVVLSAGNSWGAQLGLPEDLSATFDPIWLTSHQDLAEESTAGSLEVVPGAGHYLQADRPQAVIDGLERILGDLATP